MGTIIGIGGTFNNNTQGGGGGDSPSTELIDVNSAGISFGGTDVTKSNILEKYDFSNVAYPNQSAKWLLQLQGIAENTDNFYEMYASSLSFGAGMFQGCVLRFTDIENILIQADFTKLKDVYKLFAGSLIIVDDTTTITELKQGLPLFNNIGDYINNGPQRVIGDTIDGATIIIVDPSSTIESITLIGNINVAEGTKYIGNSLLGAVSVIRASSLDATGMQAAFPVTVKYKDINLTYLDKSSGHVLAYNPDSPVIEIGNITTPNGGMALGVVLPSTVKVGNINTETISNTSTPFVNWDSVEEVGKFPKILNSVLNMSNITNFNDATLEKLFNDTDNQGLQYAPNGSGTLYVNRTIRDRLTQTQKDNITNLGYTINIM